MPKLYNGDCSEIMRNFSDNCIDLTVTSPPYDNIRSYRGNISQWSEEKWRKIIQELYRTTANGGVVVWIVGDATVDGSETGTSFKQALWAMEQGFNLLDTMIWDEGCFSNPFPYRYHQVFNYMFIFSKGKPKTFNPVKTENKHAGSKAPCVVREKDGEIYSREPEKLGKFGKLYNIWRISPGRNTDHPAKFPEELASNHIVSWSNPKDVVLDPMMGSGTTGMTAKRLNRDFVGIELDENYFELARKKIRRIKTSILYKNFP